MVQGKWFPMDADLTQPIEVRRIVFGRGQDGLDRMARHVVVYDGDHPAGAARLWWRDGAFWLGDVGVVPERRGMGFGDLLVRLLLVKALTHGAQVIRLEAPADIAPFFERYGFQAESEEAGAVAMRISAGGVRFSHCEGTCEGCARSGSTCAPKGRR